MKSRPILFKTSFTLIMIFSGNPELLSQTWDSIGSGFSSNKVDDIISYNNQIFVCGDFMFSGTSSTKKIAAWNGNTWQQVGGGVQNNFADINCLEIYNGSLIMGGTNNFQLGGSVNANGIASWDGSVWTPLNAGITNGIIYDMAVFQGKLYVGGNFLTVDGMNIKDIASWDGNEWDTVAILSTGLSDVRSLAVFNNELYVGGFFDLVNGMTVLNIVKFDGTTWSDVGGGLNGDVKDLFVDTVNNRLYAGGNFNYAANGTVSCPSHVAYWDGLAWHPVGNSVPGIYPVEIIVYNNNLYVGMVNGAVNLSGDSLNAITKWDGIDWQPLGDGLTSGTFVGAVHSFMEYDNKLIVGGYFSQAGNINANNIATYSDSLTGIETLMNSDDIKIFPNPTLGIININLDDKYLNELPIKITIVNENGVVVCDSILYNLNNNINSKSFISSGLYYLVFKSKSGRRSTIKLVSTQ